MNKKTKKILLVITKSNFGGAQRYVFELAVSLKKRGYTVAVASGGAQGELIERLAAADLTHFPIGTLQRDLHVYGELAATIQLARIIRTFDPDVLHLNSSKAGGIGALIGRLMGVPRVVFTAHGWAYHEDRSWLWKHIIYILSWLTGLLSHAVIAVSTYDYQTAPGARVRNKTAVIHPALDAITFKDRQAAQNELWSQAATATENPWIGTIAELTANKNIAAGIKAVATYNQAATVPCRYLIIGDGEQLDVLSALIKKLQAETYIKLVGRVKDARTFLKAFDVFLLPSKKEGYPYALLEARAAGLPLIASHVGGIPEILNHGTADYLIDPENEDTIVAALKKLLATTDKERVAETNPSTLEHMVQQTIAVYAGEVVK